MAVCMAVSPVWGVCGGLQQSEQKKHAQDAKGRDAEQGEDKENRLFSLSDAAGVSVATREADVPLFKELVFAVCVVLGVSVIFLAFVDVLRGLVSPVPHVFLVLVCGVGAVRSVGRCRVAALL